MLPPYHLAAPSGAAFLMTRDSICDIALIDECDTGD